MNDDNNPFGEIIYSYTRAQALADGFQVEVTKTASEAGFRIPVFLNRSVYDAYVMIPEGVSGQDESGRLWDILWMLHCAIRKAPTGAEQIAFSLYVRNDEKSPKLVHLVSACGPYDIDDPRPALTVMLPGED